MICSTLANCGTCPNGKVCSSGKCVLGGEDCNNNIDDDTDSYADEADRTCAISLSALPSPTATGTSVQLTTTAADGSLFTGGATKNLCDAQGCQQGGACRGNTVCAGVLSCSIIAPGATTNYWACVGQNNASATLTISNTATYNAACQAIKTDKSTYYAGESILTNVSMKNTGSLSWRTQAEDPVSYVSLVASPYPSATWGSTMYSMKPAPMSSFRYLKVDVQGSWSWVMWFEIEVYDENLNKITPVGYQMSGTTGVFTDRRPSA
jgi:hypothetical protein